MGIWASLMGKKVHCTGCGAIIPVDPKNVGDEVYCSEACRENYRRLSTLPPPEAVPTAADVTPIHPRSGPATH